MINIDARSLIACGSNKDYPVLVLRNKKCFIPDKNNQNKNKSTKSIEKGNVRSIPF